MFIFVSAGAILYEATFGKAPFATDSLLTLMNKIRNEKIPKIIIFAKLFTLSII